MRVLFFGSSDYCLPILDTLKTNFSLVGIITREDKPVGRKKEIRSSAPKEFANRANIPVFTPKDKEGVLHIYSALSDLRPDMAVVADYGIIIPPKIFTLPTHQTINIHFSKLPEFRGAAPVQYTILRGDPTAWITIQKLAEELDTGDIFWQHEETFDTHQTTDGLYRKLFTIAAEELPNVINQYAKNAITPLPQNDSLATYTRRLTRNDGYIPWEMLSQIIEGKQVTEEQLNTWPLYTSVLKNLYANLQLYEPEPQSRRPITYNLQLIIDRVFRAFTPWPGLWTLLRPSGFGGQAEVVGSDEKKRLKILKLHIEPTTYSQQLTTTLVIDEVQLEGKQPVSWKQFLTGYSSQLS